VGFPDRLISVSVPNNTKEIDPLEWRSAPFFAGPTLRGLTYAPVSKGFQASVSDPNIQTNHHKGAENAGLMMSEDAKKKISRRAKGDGTTDLMEFREEMAEMPLGLLVPSLYLRQAESELYTTCEGYLQRFNKELNLVKKLATSDFALTQGDFQSPKYQETITKLEKMMQENFYRGKERIMEMKQIEAFYVDQWYAVVQGKSTRDLRKKNAATPLSTGGKGGSLVLQENQELVKQSSGASLEFISSTESGDMDEEDLLDVQEVQLRKAYADELHVNNADLSMLDNNTDLSQDQANLLSFRKSTSRKDTRLRFLPINMHLQVLTVRETTVQAKALPKISASNNLRTRLKSIASVRIGERTSSRRHLTEQSTEPRAQSKRHLLDAPPPTTAPPPATAPKRRGLLKFVGSTRDVNNPQLDEPPAMPEIEEPNQEEDITNREESFFYDTLSAGAPAAHALTSKYGGCWQQLKELTKNREDFKRTRDDAKSDLFTKLEAYRKYKEIEWMLTERVDVVLPQALSILAGAVLGRIYVMAAEFSASVLGGFEAPDDEVAQSLITHGFLVGWESLLSTHGKEMAMLGDLFYAVRYLNDHIVLRFETFVQDPAENEEEDGGPKPTSSLVDDALNVRLFKTTTKQEHDIYESADRFIGPGGSTDDAVWLLVARIPTTVVDKLPKVVRTYIESHQGTLFDPSIDDKKPIVLDEVFPKPLKWTCVLFTQGINEMQNIANMMGTRVLQEEINEYSCGILVEYCVKRFQVAPAKMDKKEKRKSKNALDKNGASSQTKEAQMKEEERLRRANIAYQQSLVWAARLRFSVKNQTQAGKSFEILQNSADLVRWLSGVRIASCKSAKDRTAMSLTWEEARILHNIHFVRDVPLLDLANLFREHGTRLINVHKNTGVPRYAFNKAQRSFLPDSYRPPMSTIGSIFGGNLS
jgi:inositol polyphosphate-4-phosphatase